MASRNPGEREDPEEDFAERLLQAHPQEKVRWAEVRWSELPVVS